MKKEKISYSEAIAEIESILKRMETNGVDIDNLSVDVSRASKLIEMCREKFLKTESDVNKILNKESETK
ncbi:MAG: exodeoxyribonuclease VII small subunit [Rikenellaceae bacterium]|nr:exodeoxyribonuclease VII small subunit [Rikenellaceae bacterium]